MSEWILNEVHSDYGIVVSMGIVEGESYRWFLKDDVVSMIPLDVLKSEEEKLK